MYFAGVDLGGTKIRVTVADDDGSIIGEDRRPTPQGPTGAEITEAIVASLEAAADEAGLAPTDITAAGVASIGPFDLEAGTVEDPSNFPPGVDTIELRDPVAQCIGSDSVTIQNDTIAGVIGERYFGDGTPANMVYLTISTGIGAGVCVDGNVVQGWNGNAGEVGHMLLDPEGRRTCGCGKAGHWEAYCSGDNIPEFARQLHEREAVDTGLPLDDPEFTARDVFAAAGEDELADRLLERVGHYNAMGMANVVHAYAPSVIYVGGAVATNNPELTLDPVREKLPDMVFGSIPELRVTSLGDDVVVKGAIASAMTGGSGDQQDQEQTTDGPTV